MQSVRFDCLAASLAAERRTRRHTANQRGPTCETWRILRAARAQGVIFKLRVSWCPSLETVTFFHPTADLHMNWGKKKKKKKEHNT